MKQTIFDNTVHRPQVAKGRQAVNLLKLKSFAGLVAMACFFYLIFTTSCANQGMPTGGVKDTIAPVLLRTDPPLRSTNFKGNDLRFTFDEFIISDEISEKLVVSPPMKKKTMVKMKGKTLILEFQEPLKKESTYSLDFKDAVVDNNEKNPIKDFRFSFSTGNTFDSLRVAGYVKDALNQEPIDKALVMLHRIKDYKAFTDSIPDYIGTTDKEGLFMIDNVAPGEYRLYALSDADNSLTYNQSAEKIAFADSIIVPSARYIAEPDTIVKGQDTIAVSGFVDYSPGPQFLRMFEEEKFDQYLDSYKRSQANRCDFFFTETLSDTFKINLLKPVPQKEWLFVESNFRKDSITAWITDSLISKSDTLLFELKYEVLDSLNQLMTKKDTIEMVYETPKIAKPRKRKKEEVQAPSIQLSNNINSSAHDLFREIVIEAPEPLSFFDTSKVKLYSVLDSVNTEIPIVVERDSNSIRKYIINHHWEPNSNYLLRIDSAAARNIYGYPNKKMEQKFRTQKEDYYGKIILTLSNLKHPAIVQLLSNDDQEKILQKIQILEDGTIEFPYLKPEKYRIRVIIDENQNGKWDTGYLVGNVQPEWVIYFPKILKTRGNFEQKEDMILDYSTSPKKELIDKDLEKEEARKKEKAKRKPGAND